MNLSDSTKNKNSLAIDSIDSEEEKLLAEVIEAVKSIRYGYVQITIQDSKVIQIDKTEKIRLDKQESPVARSISRKGNNK